VCGKIKIGDHILQANGFDLRHSSHEEVCFALALEAKVELILEEDASPLVGVSKDGPATNMVRGLTPLHTLTREHQLAAAGSIRPHRHTPSSL
jgi:hypothetical protein